MEAVLDVKNIAHCKVKIEGTNMPPSYNLIKHITLQEGTGYAVPILQLNFMDATGSLQNDLNLKPGTKCTIEITRDVSEGDRPYIGEFSLWGLERYTDSEGPALKALFILNLPKWTAGVYCENFRTTSTGVMGQIAGRAGLRYSGPGGSTNDRMNWLNINTTRSSFSEEVAMRGYMGRTACMTRIVTLDKELRYKDLFKELGKSEVATLLLNKEPTGTNPITMRETTDTSVSSVFSHWFNYGQVQHEHTLDEKGQQKTDKLNAPQMGDALPVNMDIKNQLDRKLGARVTYTGWDPGTESKPQSNIHTYYEQAFYQNLRGLGLWGEKIRTLTDFPTDLNTFDCIRYIQKDPAGLNIVDSRSRNGKYLVAGKTIRIKNGHNYTEVIDLMRPYVNNTGGQSDSPAPQQASANSGDFNLAQEAIEAQGAVGNSLTSSGSGGTTPASQTPTIQRTQTLLNDLLAFDEAVPRLPSSPLLPSGSNPRSAPMVRAQQSVIDSLTNIMQTPNPVANLIENSVAGTDTNALATVKRVSAPIIATSANETIDSILRNQEAGLDGAQTDILNNSLASVGVEKPLLDRFSDTYDNIVNERVTSVVSEVSSAGKNIGDWIGDTQNGGIFSQDLLEKGITNIEGISNELGLPEITGVEHAQNLGSNFILPAAKFDIGGGDVAINPFKTASFLSDSIAPINNGATLLKDFGSQNYQDMFGDMNPDDAFVALQDTATLADKVSSVFSPNEVLAGTGIGSLMNRESGAIGSLAQGALDGVQDIYGNTIRGPLQVLSDTGDGVGNVIGGVTETIDGMTDSINNVTGVINGTKQLADGIKNIITDPADAVKGVVRTVTDGLVDNIVTDVTQEVIGEVVGTFKNIAGEITAPIAGPIKGAIKGIIEPTGRVTASLEGLIEAVGDVAEPITGSIDTSFLNPIKEVNKFATNITGNLTGTLNLDGTLNAKINVLPDINMTPIVDPLTESQRILLDPVYKLKNTADGVSVYQDTIDEIDKTLEEVDEVLARSEQARSQFLFDDPTLTVKSTGQQAGLTLAMKPVEKKENPLAQSFAFQFGTAGVEPLLERVIDKTVDYTSEVMKDLTVVETVRDPVSWSTYTRAGSNEANKQSSENYWEFPHTDPFVVISEEEGDSYPLSENPTLSST